MTATRIKTNTYPGLFDLNWDDVPDEFNAAWLDHMLGPVDVFIAQHGVPVGVNEYGLTLAPEASAVYVLAAR